MALTWSDWKQIPGSETYSSKPVAVSWGPGRIDLFTTGSEAELLHNWWDGNWNSWWEPLGGVLKITPNVISRGPDLLDIFCIGTDNRMYHKSYDPLRGWVGFTGPIGNTIGDWRLSVVSWGPTGSNRIDVFAVSTESQLLHLYTGDGKDWYPQRDGVPEWENLGGILTSKPVVVSWAENRLDIFALGSDQVMYHNWFGDSGWGHWEGLAGILLHAPSGVSWAPNRLDVFGIGPGVDGTGERMLHLFWDGSGWGPAPSGNIEWEELGVPFLNGYFDGEPLAISRSPGLLDIFGIGRNVPVGGGVKIDDLQHKAYENGWHPYSFWESLSAYSDVSIASFCAVATEKGHVMVMAVGRDEFSGLYFIQGTE